MHKTSEWQGFLELIQEAFTFARRKAWFGCRPRPVGEREVRASSGQMLSNQLSPRFTAMLILPRRRNPRLHGEYMFVVYNQTINFWDNAIKKEGTGNAYSRSTIKATSDAGRPPDAGAARCKRN